MILAYHFLTFTLFNIDTRSKYSMGISYLVWMGILISLNFVTLVFNRIKKYQRKKELKRLRKAFEIRRRNLQLIVEAKREIKDMELRFQVRRNKETEYAD